MKADLRQRLNFALRNVFRQRVRSAGTLAAIALGVAGLLGHQAREQRRQFPVDP